MATARPARAMDPYAEQFWAFTRERELRLQQCSACGKFRWPPGPTCDRFSVHLLASLEGFGFCPEGESGASVHRSSSVMPSRSSLGSMSTGQEMKSGPSASSSATTVWGGGYSAK